MKLLQIITLTLCLNIPMAHAGGDQSFLRKLAGVGTLVSITAVGVAAMITYEECVAPRRRGLGGKGGLSFPHAVIAATVVAASSACAETAAESFLDSLNL